MMNDKALRFFGDTLFVVIQIVGVAAFAYPLIMPQTQAGEAMAHAADAPIVLGVTLVGLFGLLGVMRVNAKHIAVLGVLCAVNAVLRLVTTVVVPMPNGFSPMFLLFVLVGYAYGARFGFLFGAFSLLTSAVATGGVGPWLPFQIFGAGWVGLTAGWISDLRWRIADYSPRSAPAWRAPHAPVERGKGRGGPPTFRWKVGQAQAEWDRGVPKSEIRNPKLDLVLLVPFGFIWGLLYGAILNLYFWPLVDAGTGMSWQAGLGIGEVLARYTVFYVTTSLWWDFARAIGNVALLAWLGLPILRALLRFGARFQFETETRFL